MCCNTIELWERISEEVIVTLNKKALGRTLEPMRHSCEQGIYTHLLWVDSA